MWEIVVAALAVVVAFLFYRLQRMKSIYDNAIRVSTMGPGLGVGKRLSGLETDSLLDTEVNERMHSVEDRLSGMEKKIKTSDDLVRKLVKELGK